MSDGSIEKRLDYEVRGLDCPDCALSLERAVQQLPGVVSARLVYATSRLTVMTHDGADLPEQLRDVASSMGYQVVQEGEEAEISTPPGLLPWLRANEEMVSMAVGGTLLLAGVLLQALGASPLVVRLVLGTSIVLGGYPMARAGWNGMVKGRSLDMNALMTIAAIGAMVVGEYTEGAVVVFLFALGEFIEGFSADRARHAIRGLMQLAPTIATRLGPAGPQQVPVAVLAVGDHILARPGERIPMDGRVLEGRSAVDQAPVTGESVPVEKAPDSEVFAGTLNGQGPLIVEVTRRAEENTIARIMRMVEEAQAGKAPVERFVDRFARVYTPLVVGAAVLIATVPPLLGLGALGEWVYRALVLLVIACPCALVISTPVTLVSALARAAQAGVLIKGGRYLEQLAQLKAIAFDKTGTLTVGQPTVVAGGCVLDGSESDRCSDCDDLLAKAAAVEASSEHALARAVIAHAESLGVAHRYPRATKVLAIPGLGIQGTVEGHAVTIGSTAHCEQNSGLADPLCKVARRAEEKGRTVLVIQDSCCDTRCFLAVADELRPEAEAALDELRRAGIERTIMLTGDNAHVAQSVADRVGIDDVRAGLFPGHKVDAVAELTTQYGKVGMVGDGVNDAPALARAHVGIAMGVAGSDVALETADVALMNDDLHRLPFAIGLSRRALGIVRTNIAASLLLKAVFIGLGAAGYATLWMAVLADVGVSLAVSINGLRMLRYRR